MEEKTVLKKRDANVKRNVAHGIGNSKKSRKNTVRIAKIGQCDKCGQIIIRAFECSHGVCGNHNSPTVIYLEPVIVVCKDYYLRLISLANQGSVNLERLVDTLSRTTYEELYQKGLVNLAKVKFHSR